MRLSVIIPAYNAAEQLELSLAHLTASTEAPLECIVVDDGSTDGSDAEVAGLPVQYVWKESRGISSARNRGISLAHGDYIAFLDVDDLWKKGKLSLQMNVMQQEQSPISYTDEVWIRNGKRLNQGKRHRKYSGLIYEHCLPLCIISPSSAVISRSIFEDVGLFDEALPVCEDYDMWLRITCRYPVLFVERPLIIKQGGHPDQLSRRYEAMDTFRIKGLAKVLSMGVLTAEQRKLTMEELKKKCSVYIQGARKRGRLEEAQEYVALVDSLMSPPPPTKEGKFKIPISKS